MTIGVERAAHLRRKHLAAHPSETEFTLLGRTWTLLPGVFAPTLTPVTEIFSSWLPYPRGGGLLEIGSGAGVTAVTAAHAGCRHVTATDIGAAAVENTRRNVERHGVGDVVTVRRSDLFEAIPAGDVFDVVYWNSNFVEVPADHAVESEFDLAFVDPGYEAHRRYLRDAPRHLAPDGRLLLGFTGLGNWDRLAALGAELGLHAEIVRAERRRLEIEIEFQLVELRPADGGPWGR